MKVMETYEFAGEKLQLERVVQVTQGPQPGGVKRKAPSSSNLGNLLETLKGPKKMSAMQKSALDWNKYKKDSGKAEDIELEAKESGYVEKQNFLGRVDQRQFELEREKRERERAAMKKNQ